MSNVEVDHIGIATESIKHSSVFWECLGFTSSGEEIVEEQGVKIRFLTGKQGSKIELLEPLKEDTPIGKFIRNRGPGIQQLAIKVVDINKIVLELKKSGIKIINEKPSIGANGKLISFIHPSSTGGVLVELIQD